MKLVIGNKNYSSWSLRPWLMLRQLGVPFDEEIIPLDQASTREAILARSPSGRVPALIDGALTVWDSLAIIEYLNERYPERGVWPAERVARAVARSVSAEMHSGFTSLRAEMPMSFRSEGLVVSPSPAAEADIQRILELWSDARARFGGAGPFLFGAFSAADAMFAPVVSRFRTYGVALSGACHGYAETIWQLVPMKEWLAGARAETWVMKRYAHVERQTSQ